MLNIPGPELKYKTGHFCIHGHENCRNLPNNEIRTVCINRAEIDAYQKKMNDISTRINQLQGERDNVQQAFTAIDEKYNDIQSQYQAGQDTIDELQAQTQSISQTLDKQKSWVSDIQYEQSHLESEVISLDNQITQAQREIFNAQQDLSFAENELTYLHSQIEQAKQSLARASDSPIDFTDAQLAEIARRELEQEADDNQQIQPKSQVNEDSDGVLAKIAMLEIVQEEMSNAKNLTSQAWNTTVNTTQEITQDVKNFAKDLQADVKVGWRTVQDEVKQTRKVTSEIFTTVGDLWPSGGADALTKLIGKRAEEVANIVPQPTGNLIVDYETQQSQLQP
jgi:chromosome segregation ATPase